MNSYTNRTTAKETILHMSGSTDPRTYYLADQIDRLTDRMGKVESRQEMTLNMERERGDRNIHPALMRMKEEAANQYKM